MINLNNYESWFLQYADDECTPAEQQAVGEFLLLHPELREELDQMLDLRLSPDKVVMPGKEFLRFAELELLNEQYRLEPDLSVVFEGKHTLYKKERLPLFYLYRTLSAAAVLVFGLAMYWLLSDEPEKQNIVREVNAPVSAARPKEESKILTVIPLVIKNAKKSRDVSSSIPSFTSAADERVVPQQETDQTLHTIAQTEEPVLLQEEKKTISNLSEEVLKAAATRMENRTTVDPVAIPLNTSVVIQDATRPANKKSLRSLVRTVSRRILHDTEKDDESKFIQVANFHIHVKH